MVGDEKAQAGTVTRGPRAWTLCLDTKLVRPLLPASSFYSCPPSSSGPRSFTPPASVIDIQLNPTEGQKRRGEENAAKIINRV